jgi:hypothetical protein
MEGLFILPNLPENKLNDRRNVGLRHRVKTLELDEYFSE